MSSIKAYAREVFDELNKRKSKNKFKAFINEFNKILEESENENDVGCPVSNDCSWHGCSRYCVCDAPNKKINEVK